MPQPGTQGFKCVQNKIAAYKKRTGRQPNQSIIGTFQTECYKNESNRKELEIRSKAATMAAKEESGRAKAKY